MYGCAVSIAVAEPAAELEGATVEDMAPEAAIPEPMMVPLAVAAVQAVADTSAP